MKLNFDDIIFILLIISLVATLAIIFHVVFGVSIAVGFINLFEEILKKGLTLLSVYAIL